MIEAAVRLLEPHGPTPELARALAQLSGQRMTTGTTPRRSAHRASAPPRLARELDLPDVVADALNNRGCSLPRAWARTGATTSARLSRSAIDARADRAGRAART